MKIAIMTIQSRNYGNRLQNYALQTLLERLGHSPESLKRDAGFYGSARSKLRTIWHAAGRVRHENDKIAAFDRFDRENIRLSQSIASSDFVSRDIEKLFDCFVIGSDQIWNPEFNGSSEVEYLPMVPKGKKIAYAASFGVADLSANLERTGNLLEGISSVSVREYAGARIVENLTGRSVPVVLDPTLLLSLQDWESIAKKPMRVSCDRPFAFKYMLGNDVNNEQVREYAKLCGLEVIDVMDERLSIGPSEFVWLVARSSLVCTDSFHASIFALLNHKPLAIFERVSLDADMSSRFDTLCSLFGIGRKRSSELLFGLNSTSETDWVAFESRLKELRDISLAWLECALNGVARGNTCV